jgi:hypothetical protein
VQVAELEAGDEAVEVFEPCESRSVEALVSELDAA